MSEEQNQTEGQERDTEIAGRVAAITDVFSDALAALLKRRDSQYAAAVAPLDVELAALQQEHTELSIAAEKLAEVLPARARQAQFEADKLTVAGKHEQAAVKREEQRAAENEPGAISQRQQEISARVTAIGAEKQAAARRIFEVWFSEVQAVSRSIEHGHFIVFLAGLKQSFFDFEQRTDTAAKAVGERGLFGVGHLASLTADEHSAEWREAQRWYAGRSH